jgi:hypothetical protein
MRLADRRTATRFEILGELWGSVQATEPLRLCNLGREGALVESVAPLPVGSTQAIRLIRGTNTAEIRATVRHLSPVYLAGGGRRYLVGLQFMNLDEPATVWIEHMMNEQPKRSIPDEA